MCSRRGGRRSRAKGVVWGFVLIALGTCFLLMMNGVLPYDMLDSWWPVFVIAAGVGSLVSARDSKSFGSGITTLGFGCWLMVASNGWYGLGWSRSWPLALVAVGLGSLAEALARGWWRTEEEAGHVG